MIAVRKSEGGGTEEVEVVDESDLILLINN
jgi:hypothetical protein